MVAQNCQPSFEPVIHGKLIWQKLTSHFEPTWKMTPIQCVTKVPRAMWSRGKSFEWGNRKLIVRVHFFVMSVNFCSVLGAELLMLDKKYQWVYIFPTLFFFQLLLASSSSWRAIISFLTEIHITVSKLLSFETFANFLRVSVKGAGSFHIHRKTMKELGALAVQGVREQPNLAQNLVTHRHW